MVQAVYPQSVDPMTRYANVVEFRHDGGASAEGGFGSATSGGSYGFTPTGNEPGAAYGGATTQTSATGAVAIRTGFTSFNASNGKLYYMHCEAFVTALSDGTNSYVVYSGFSDSSTGAEPNNGAYFEYDHTVSANWQCVTAAGGSRTKTTTSVPVKVSASGADKLQVKIEGGVAKFWINDTLVHTESLTIPSGWAQSFGATMSIRKTAGTTARIVAFDMLYARQELTTSRNVSEPAFA